MKSLRYKILKKTFFIFVVVFISIVAVTLLIAYANFFSQIRYELSNTSISLLKQISAQSDMLLKESDRQVINLQDGYNTLVFMNGAYFSQLEKAGNIIELQNQLRTLKHSNENIDTIGLYSFLSDMVITDRNYQKAEDFYDMEWKDALKGNNIYCWMDTRTAVEAGMKKNVVTLVRTFPLGARNNPKGLIFVNIKQESLNAIVSNISINHSSEIFIANSSVNKIIAFPQNKNPLDDLNNSEIPRHASLAGDSSFQYKNGQNNYLFFTVQSFYNGWKYISLFNLQGLGTILQVRNFLLITCTIVFTFLVCAVFLVTRHTLRPVLNFWESSADIVNTMLPSKKLEKYAISFDSLEEIISDTLLSNQKMGHQIEEKVYLVKWKLVTDLFMGYKRKISEAENDLTFIGKELPYRKFTVISILFRDKKKQTDLRAILEGIIQLAEKIFNPEEGRQAMAIELNDPGVGILVNYDDTLFGNEASFMEQCYDIGLLLREYVKKEHEKNVYFGVGKPVEFVNICESYEMSLEAANNPVPALSGNESIAPVYSAQIMPKVQEFIKKNYLNPNISLNMLEEEFHLSVSYLSRIFKECMNTNYMDYLTSLRMEKAKELLAVKGAKVTEISERVGYQNQQSFIRAFKKYTKCTPRAYRNAWYISEFEDVNE